MVATQHCYFADRGTRFKHIWFHKIAMLLCLITVRQHGLRRAKFIMTTQTQHEQDDHFSQTATTFFRMQQSLGPLSPQLHEKDNDTPNILQDASKTFQQQRTHSFFRMLQSLPTKLPLPKKGGPASEPGSQSTSLLSFFYFFFFDDDDDEDDSSEASLGRLPFTFAAAFALA